MIDRKRPTLAMSSLALLVFAFGIEGCVGTAVGDLPSSGGQGASGTGTSYENLFSVPRSLNVTPNTIHGLWSGTANGAEVRVRFTPTAITIAKRCSSSDVVSGAQVSARVSSGAIEVLENRSGATPGSSCIVELKPIAIPACATAGDDDDDCFSMSGTLLDIGAALFVAQNGGSGSTNDRSFTKISD